MKKKNHILSKKSVIYAKNNLFFLKCRSVRDHCHYAGKYRGAAPNICNLRCKTTK